MLDKCIHRDVFFLLTSLAITGCYLTNYVREVIVTPGFVSLEHWSLKTKSLVLMGCMNEYSKHRRLESMGTSSY